MKLAGGYKLASFNLNPPLLCMNKTAHKLTALHPTDTFLCSDCISKYELFLFSEGMCITSRITCSRDQKAYVRIPQGVKLVLSRVRKNSLCWNYPFVVLLWGGQNVLPTWISSPSLSHTHKPGIVRFSTENCSVLFILRKWEHLTKIGQYHINDRE